MCPSAQAGSAQRGPGRAGRPPRTASGRTTRHLNAATADAVLQAVLERAAGRSLLWVTHRPDELAAFPEAHHLGADPECIGPAA